MLLVEDLEHAYGARIVLSVARWEVPAGARRAVVGRSGSGKTTLLAILAGLVRATRGTLRVDGLAISPLGVAALDRWRARHVGIVMQSPHLLAPLDAVENVVLAQHLAGETVDAGRARGLLDTLGVGGRARAKPSQMSRGEQQHVQRRVQRPRPGMTPRQHGDAHAPDPSSRRSG